MILRYVHGYDQRENIRLQDQASTLVELLHADTFYPAKSQVLEAGCGVGAQTMTLASNTPLSHIFSIDISETSVVKAKEKIDRAGLTNLSFLQADIFKLGPQCLQRLNGGLQMPNPNWHLNLARER